MTGIPGSSDQHSDNIIKPSHEKTNNRPNQAVQPQKRTRSLKFRIKEEEMYYFGSKNTEADQLRSYCTADLQLYFHLCMLLVFLCSSLYDKTRNK